MPVYHTAAIIARTAVNTAPAMSADQPSPWICPVCRAPLAATETGLRCQADHCFDRAREGHVNLLPANKKHSREPGDSPSMLRARRAFLEAGHYGFLAKRLAHELTTGLTDGARLLDVGCGEGYYLGQVCAGLADKPHQALGIDISKAAVRMAARRHPEAQFAIASGFDLPVADHSIDLLLRVFAPGDHAETLRVLKPDGLLCVVTPGPRHLFQLKQLIYREPREHPPARLPTEGLEAMAEIRLQQRLQLDDADAVSNLLAMTPLFWQADEALQNRLGECRQVDWELDFIIHRWRRQKADEPAL